MTNLCWFMNYDQSLLCSRMYHYESLVAYSYSAAISLRENRFSLPFWLVQSHACWALITAGTCLFRFVDQWLISYVQTRGRTRLKLVCWEMVSCLLFLKGNRLDIVCCVKLQEGEEVKKDSFLFLFFEKIYAPCLLKNWVRPVIVSHFSHAND